VVHPQPGTSDPGQPGSLPASGAYDPEAPPPAPPHAGQVQYPVPVRYPTAPQYGPGGWPPAPAAYGWGVPADPAVTLYPPQLPERPRRNWLLSILTALLASTTLVVFCGAGAAVAAARQNGGPVTAAWIAQMRPEQRDRAMQAVLDRRSKAVLGHDSAGFMADVDSADAGFVKKQQQQYDNLAKLPFSEFRYLLEPANQYPALVSAQVRSRYHTLVRAPGVTVFYRLDGLDQQSVAAPWVPLFGVRDGRWMLVGEAADKTLPTGSGGQPWDAGPIRVVRSGRVLAVVSADDGDHSSRLLAMSERALDRVAAVRKGGWAGKIMITAVQERQIFDTYFAESPDKVAQVAAIAVPYYSQVPTWHSASDFAATRVVFNPDQLAADEGELFHDLTHEFTHAAMGPVTSGYTPSWLVEGFAEYVPYKNENVPTNWLHRVLTGVKTDGGLPGDTEFYNEPRNYVTAWLACRMIAERYGEAKLVALYEAFRSISAQDSAVRQALGVGMDALVAQWQKYVEKARTSTLG
jgi:hypothetical protein